MNTTVQKWGNSLALRIPMPFAKNIHLHQGSQVEVLLTKGRIEVRPKEHRKKYVLSNMLRRISKSSLHADGDWGRVGLEMI